MRSIIAAAAIAAVSASSAPCHIYQYDSIESPCFVSVKNATSYEVSHFHDFLEPGAHVIHSDIRCDVRVRRQLKHALSLWHPNIRHLQIRTYGSENLEFWATSSTGIADWGTAVQAG